MEQSSPKPLPRRLRFEILRRDNHACRYCGASAPDVKLTVDHVLPLSLGGTHDPTNLVTACRDCNAGKASTSPHENVVADVSAKVLAWSAALTQAAAAMSARATESGEYVAAVDAKWLNFADSDDEPLPRPAGWQVTVKRWHELGLPLDVAVDSIDVAMAAPGLYNVNVWRYFCGVAWRRVNEMQELARTILDGNV